MELAHDKPMDIGKTAKEAGGVVLAVACNLSISILYGVTFAVMWSWFMVGRGLPAINGSVVIAGACMIGLIRGLIWNDTRIYWQWLIGGITRCGMVLAVGYWLHTGHRLGILGV